MFRKAILVLVVSILIVPQGFAKSKSPTEINAIESYEKFQVQVTEIRGEMIVGGRYEFLKGRDREIVNHTLDSMAELLQASGSVTAMPADARSSLIADQQAVNELLTRFADNRVICTHEAPIGSLIPQKRCRTLRQIEKTRSTSRNSLSDTQRDADLDGE